MHYRLDLNSNFTYGLYNPVEGDQFKQRDDREVFCLGAGRTLSHTLAGLAGAAGAMASSSTPAACAARDTALKPLRLSPPA
ncbi:MAG: hypothetical protein IPF94_13165 [Betaproteobacteria bacterium]|nr:hypothetical protein [Betaproteobacteria bacterium]